ncbi:hypothetical protein [Micrococcus luteus]|uniref:hypothetical protein n=1 Tax=Micrococcus luteus TaxID=1270 RepID=UPI0034229722
MPDLAPLWEGLTDPQVLSASVGVLGAVVGAAVANRHATSVADRERAFKLVTEDGDTFEKAITSMVSTRTVLISTFEERRHDARQRQRNDWIKASSFFANAESQRAELLTVQARLHDHPMIGDLATLSEELSSLVEASGRAYGAGIEEEEDLDLIESQVKAWDVQASDLLRRAIAFHAETRSKFLPKQAWWRRLWSRG